ncbi:AraC family transcriptional regulator [Listeria costaricensis]|uniref:AraC family transcriptional regulator n=1 Tax=Listeria costaricensis TaxID=2026604 RepID=UPI000C07620B|nr:helix-turn-helix domain-containing protein [Listeria costaricensis]
MFKIDTNTFNPQILYVGDCYTNEPRIGENHHHDFVEFSIIYEGQVKYNIEGKEYWLKQGDMLVLNPGVRHFDIAEPGMHNVQLHIGFRNFSLTGFPRNTFPFKEAVLRQHDTSTEILPICDEILREKSEEKPGYDLLLKTYVMQLIIQILRETEPRQIRTSGLKLSMEELEKQQLVNQIIYYMEKHHTEEVSLSTLSETMYISPAYISRVFKEETGDSPIHYLIKIRLEKAYELLKDERLTVKEAAKLVGYNDAYYFSKLFKKHYGFPPSHILQRTS